MHLAANPLVERVTGWSLKLDAVLASLGAPLLLLVRLYLAEIFLRSGVLKVASWDSTLALFENEYQVPLLSPMLAAVMGTGAELVLPVLLVLGLGTRFAALALFAFNIVAVLSYPDISEAGVKDHQSWGILIAVLATVGGGRLTLDHWLRGK